jgi:hypothetical protein
MTTEQTQGQSETRPSEVRSDALLAAVQSLRDECEASSRLITPALDRDGGARLAFKTVTERLDKILAANARLTGPNGPGGIHD